MTEKDQNDPIVSEFADIQLGEVAIVEAIRWDFHQAYGETLNLTPREILTVMTKRSFKNVDDQNKEFLRIHSLRRDMGKLGAVVTITQTGVNIDMGKTGRTQEELAKEWLETPDGIAYLEKLVDSIDQGRTEDFETASALDTAIEVLPVQNIAFIALLADFDEKNLSDEAIGMSVQLFEDEGRFASHVSDTLETLLREMASVLSDIRKGDQDGPVEL